MQFSILIPVYNTRVDALAASLLLEAQKISDNFEILFLDDCSDLSISYLNLKLKQVPWVKYEVLTENMGRSKIRNLLFEKAQYENCIILDDDVGIIVKHFIENYIKHLKENEILVGGHQYQEQVPENEQLRLHWLYGTKQEVSTAFERQKNPYHSFMSSNFACTKSTFYRLKFNEQIQGYGHEDTLFGIEAERKKIGIKHINNPVLHEGLDEVESFLSKQENAIKNLKNLCQNEEIYQELAKHSKLIKASKMSILTLAASLFKQHIAKNLRSKNPSLMFLQMQKLLWFKTK